MGNKHQFIADHPPGMGYPLIPMVNTMFRSIILSLSSILILGACNVMWGGGEIPYQPYTNILSSLGSDTGNLSSRILFPSEYTQRSIRFSVNGITFVTHPDGRFRISRLPVGNNRLSIKIKGYEPVERNVLISDGEMAVLKDVALSPARGMVLGQLVNNKGVKAHGIQVQLDSNGGVGVSDRNGIFRFMGVPSGEHLLLINDPRFSPSTRKFALLVNEHRNLGTIMVQRVGRSYQKTAQLDH